MVIRSLILAAVLAGAVAFGGRTVEAQINPSDSGAGVKRGIQQLNTSGQVGTMTLFERGQKTMIFIQLSAEAQGRTEPAHIHRAKSCEELNPVPAFPLSPVVNRVSQTLVDVPITRLLSGNYAINVHASANNLKHYVACGHLDQ